MIIIPKFVFLKKYGDEKMTNNKYVLNWIEEMAAITKPDKIVWIDGTEEQAEALRAEACSTGEMTKLNEELLPNCYLHRTAVNDVARVEGRTYICTPTKEEAGNVNNWMDPEEMYAKLYKLYTGAMQGRTMYVIPYSMGVVGSDFAKYGIELTDSIYVVLNMLIMTRVGTNVLEALGDSPDYIKGLHAKADIDEENRYIVHFPQDNTIMSVNSGYGGNVLLGKKCFALRIASYLGRKEGWMAEHMLILGLENPEGEIKYISAAFPSACGKTNLAMLIPPEIFKKKGYKVWCVGDDIAWLRVGADGRLWAVNPENGFFGVAPGTNDKSNPNALATTMRDTIFTNVVHDLDNNTVWWEGLNDNPPANAIDWRGNPWNISMYDKNNKAATAGAHPNSRFTALAQNCPCISSEFNSLAGVPISAIVFGGRRAKTAPLVYQSFNWQHGTFVGSIMASETTAAAAGAVGVVRRDPMAMRPFVGYNMGDYFKHWLEMGKVIPNAPKIFHVNWFRTDDEGHFIWPGFGDNMRVLNWIIDRCEGKAEAVETAIGYVPKAEDINIEGLDITIDTIRDLLTVDVDSWKEDVENIKEFYALIGEHVPAELHEELAALEARLNK
ncbi:MAG: phosphoenolpyruvate carboxykinase (GTP) [Ruminococcaceae bacterium]|nr:phosphoenolpyruvate carboxykinase (GTP) [Oscillospiraceae bacterium]